MQDRTFVASIRSRLGAGQSVWLAELESARLVTVRVRRRSFEVADRACRVTFASVDEVLAYLAASGGRFELRD